MNSISRVSFLVANTQREKISASVRNAVLAAHDGLCQHCCENDADAVDHIIPVNSRTSDISKIAEMDISAISDNFNCLENYMAACTSCNASKSNNVLPKEQTDRLLALARSKKEIVEFYIGIQKGSLKPSQIGFSSESRTFDIVWQAAMGEHDALRKAISMTPHRKKIENAVIASALAGNVDNYRILNGITERSSRLHTIREHILGFEGPDITFGHITILDEIEREYEDIAEEQPKLVSPKIMKWLTEADRVDLLDQYLAYKIDGYDILQTSDKKLILGAASRINGLVNHTILSVQTSQAAKDIALEIALLSENRFQIATLLLEGADISVRNYGAVSYALERNVMMLRDVYSEQIELLLPPEDSTKSSPNERSIDFYETQEVERPDETLVDFCFDHFELTMPLDDFLAHTLIKGYRGSRDFNGTLLENARRLMALGADIDERNISAYVSLCENGFAYRYAPEEREEVLTLIADLGKGKGEDFLSHALEKYFGTWNVDYPTKVYKNPPNIAVKDLLVSLGATVDLTSENGLIWAAAYGDENLFMKYVDKYEETRDILPWHIAYRYAQHNKRDGILSVLDGLGVTRKSQKFTAEWPITKEDIVTAANDYREIKLSRPSVKDGYEDIDFPNGLSLTWRQIGNGMYTGKVPEISKGTTLNAFLMEHGI